MRVFFSLRQISFYYTLAVYLSLVWLGSAVRTWPLCDVTSRRAAVLLC